MKIKTLIITSLILTFISLNISANSLSQKILSAIQKSDPSGHFQGITYRLTYNNQINFSHNPQNSSLLFTPLSFGREHFPSYDFNPKCKNCDHDLGLPSCKSTKDCKLRSVCSHLNAFENGISGNNKKLCLSHSDAYLDHYYDVITAAKHEVDIATYYPFPNGRYLATLRNSITKLSYKKNNHIKIYVLVGVQDMPRPPKNTNYRKELKNFLQNLTRDINPKSNITVRAITSMTSGFFHIFRWGSWQLVRNITFNHAKIIVADRKAVITGGHNLWDASYLGGDPITDIDIVVNGDAAQDAQNFFHYLWNDTCLITKIKDYSGNYGYIYTKNHIRKSCNRTKIDKLANKSSATGNLPILSVARLGTYWIKKPNTFANQSDIAILAAFNNAHHIIRISQQDLVNTAANFIQYWPKKTLSVLAKFLIAKNGKVFIIISGKGAKGKDGISYSYSVPLNEITRKIFTAAKEEYRNKKTDQEIAKQLHRNLHIKYIAILPNYRTWPDGMLFGNHAKVWIIDNKAFYIGSHNMYPANLQEFGYIIFGKKITKKFITQYWNKVWRLAQGCS